MVDEFGEHFVGGFWRKLTVWGLECGMEVLVLWLTVGFSQVYEGVLPCTLVCGRCCDG
jgi:hypothetical protein